MRYIIASLVLTCLTTSAVAADDSIFGTHWVKYQPMQVRGEVQGCELTFLTVVADRVYRDGNPVAINGSIVLRGMENGLALMLKIGLKDFATTSEFERPTFAYLQTANATTARLPQQSKDGEPGYKLFIYRVADADSMAVLEELMTSGRISIGYNRKSDGIDVVVPLDLLVVESEYQEPQRVLRTRSPAAAEGFSGCALKIIDRVLGRNK